MQVFAKRFWGFDPATWPIVSFSKSGNRDALIRQSSAGDVVVFVGTQSEPTAPADQGRLLGFAEFARSPIDALDVLKADDIPPYAYDRNNKFKWPKAIPMLRAWRYPDKPRLKDVFDQQMTYEATVRAVLLGERNRDAVMALDREEVEVPDVEAIRRHRRLGDALSTSGPTRGPAPSSWSGEFSRNTDAPTSTYAFRFGTRDLSKVGHTRDVRGRLAEVNRHVPREAIGENWTVGFTHNYQTQDQAYAMEQRVLKLLAAKRTEGERVACTEGELREAWLSALSA